MKKIKFKGTLIKGNDTVNIHGMNVTIDSMPYKAVAFEMPFEPLSKLEEVVNFEQFEKIEIIIE